MAVYGKSVKLKKCRKVNPGATIGICSPSAPGHKLLSEKYLKGLDFLKSIGFNIREGEAIENWRNNEKFIASSSQRSSEIQALFEDSETDIILTSIGGLTSGSILPYFDFELAANEKKIFCGFSDNSTIHAGLISQGKITSIYGPSVIAGFGDQPKPSNFTINSFLDQIGIGSMVFPKEIIPPSRWSNDFIDATRKGWAKKEKIYKVNMGWIIARRGNCQAPLFVFNQNTLLSLAGTKYFPNLENCILVLEQMSTNMELEERQFNHLAMIGIFKKLKGLIISKPENFLPDYDIALHMALILEFANLPDGSPIIMNFDCGHTTPMISMPQGCLFEIDASYDIPRLFQLEAAFEE
jgi:muramoyltetrapeptide carboxypeptidase